MFRNVLAARARGMRTASLMCLALVAAIAVAACGKTSSTTTNSATTTGATTGAATTTAATTTAAATTVATGTGCGDVPNMGYKDASGVLASLPASTRANFNGYPTPIFKSAYADLKPKSGPITIGVSFTQPVSADQAAFIQQVTKALHGVKGVTSVKVLIASVTGLTQQIAQVNSLINEHVTYLVVEPLAAPPFIPVAARAEKAGIPFISLVNSTPTPDSINIAPNSVLDGATAGAKLAKQIGEKGLVIGVRGIPGVAVDTQTFTGFGDAFKQCPNIKVDTSIIGQFQVPVAKQATLAWLTSHPAPVAGTFNTAGMGMGIVAAFQQTGRKLPMMVAAGPTSGELAFYLKNPSNFSSAYTVAPDGLGTAAGFVVSQLVAGHGPKISELADQSLVIDGSDLSKYVAAGTSVTDTAPVEGVWNSPSYLAQFFNK